MDSTKRIEPWSDRGDDRMRNVTSVTHRRAIFAGVIGNLLEWYDFGIYGILATILGRHFFPSAESYLSLLATFGAFGAGFIARPIGSFVLGRASDSLGRKATLLITVTLMAIGTVGIGLTPTYQSIGIAAPIILVCARLVQGFAAGGEWGGAVTFLVEWAPPGRRGFFGSMVVASVSAGLLLGSGVVAVLSSVMSNDTLLAWGWRIPFLLGGALIPLAIYMRRSVDEPPVFRNQDSVRSVLPARRLTKMVMRAAAFCLPLQVASYMVTVYMPSYGALYGHIPRSAALWANTCSLALMVVGIPLIGHLSDRVGRKPLQQASCIAFVLLAYPLYTAIVSGVPIWEYFAIQFGLTLMTAGFSACAVVSLTEMFPTGSRTSGTALGSAIAALIGGFAPFLSTWMIEVSGRAASPSILLVIAALSAMLAMRGMRETALEELQ